MLLLIVQVILNLIYSFFANPSNNKAFKTVAIVIFPLVAIILPLLPFIIALADLVTGSPDSVAFGYPGDLWMHLLFQIIISLFIQIVCNTFFINKIQSLRLKAKETN